MAGAQKRIKIVFLGVLLTVALASPLSAQEEDAALTTPSASPAEEAWVFVSWTTGGTEEEREYFDLHLPDAVWEDGWTLAGTMEEADLFITADLAYNYELRLQAITVQLHDSVTGEQIASNAMGYTTVTDMDQWNNLLIEELMKDIPRYEHVPRVAEPPLPPPPLTLSERLWGVDHYWLHLAPRVGGDVRFYSPLQGGNTVGGSFNVGGQLMVEVLPFLGIQVEALFTMDFAPLFAIYDNKLDATKATAMTASLMIPVVVMVPFRPNEWLIAPFGGVYVNIPLGKMTITDVTSEEKVQEDLPYQWQDNENWMGLGWTAGIEVGRKMGPGTLFMDIRFIGDFGDMVAENGKFTARRSGLSLSVGYEFQFFKKKAKAK